MQRLGFPCSSDLRRGADKLHEKLDGRILMPDWLGVLLVGIASAGIPMALIWLLYKGVN